MNARFARVAALDDELIRRSATNVEANRRVFEAMYRRAVDLGALPPRDPLDGIDVDVRIARTLHVREATGTNRPGS